MTDVRDEEPALLDAEEIQTLENLVFSEDRLKFLQENFSKTDESFWFYRLLTLQNHFGCSTGSNAKTLASSWDKFKKVEELKASKAIADLRLRQDVINYEKSTNPVKKQTIMKLRDMIQPDFALQEIDNATGKKKSKGPQSTLELDTKTLLAKSWFDFNMEKRTDLSNVFTACASAFLANQNLSPEQVGDFLDLVENEAPEIPYILPHVRKDLENNDVDFGDRTIHYRLTKEHLDLLSKTKQCVASENYMKCFAWKLRRVTDASYVFDTKAREAYLNDLKAFADNTLSRNAKFNSLRALILFNWLLFQESEKGNYDKRVLKTYMKIPKATVLNEEGDLEFPGYAEEIYSAADPEAVATLDYAVDLIPELEPIIDDEMFIRRALRHVFSSSDDNTAKWKDVVDIQYLRMLYCEVKLSKGQGKTADLRRAYGKFGKYAFQDLCNKTNLELLKSNATYMAVEDSVSLTVLVKNIPEMEVRIYQVDCKEYFLRYKKRVSLDIPLEGLAPNYVIKKTYNDPPLLERARTIELTKLRNKRGVFVVEFFGGGVKTRALIRKGELRFVSSQEKMPSGGLGYKFICFNELNKPVKNGELYMDGVRYCTQEGSSDGAIYVPFAAANQESCPMILEDLDNPGSATINFFNYKTENYRLECGLFIDRESLLEKHQCQIVVRPTLILNDSPVSVENLKNAQITIKSTDAQGDCNVQVLALELNDSCETICNMTVPTELRKVDLKVTCQVLSGSRQIDLSLEKTENFGVNAIDGTDCLADMHLIPRGSKGYVLAVLGKNGEPYKAIKVDIELSHRYFQEKLKYTLVTDDDGCIMLGRLPDVRVIEAIARSDQVYQPEEGENKQQWILLHDQVNVPTIVNIKKGDTVRIPFMTGGPDDPKVDVYDIDFVKKFPNVSYKNGYIEIRGLPGGIFQAFIRDSQDAEVLIHVSKGDVFGNHIVTGTRICQLSEDTPLQITEVKGNRDDGYQIQISGANANTRVHILSSHLVPRFSSYLFLASPDIPLSVLETQAYPGLYGDMEEVSTEFKYIGSRKKATKYAGNLLERPSLLSKKWTTAALAGARAINEYQEEEAEDTFVAYKSKWEDIKPNYEKPVSLVQSDSANLEFLKEPSKVLFNSAVDANGVVTIPADAISQFQNLLQIIAVDDNNTCLRNVILQDVEAQPYKDVRLQNPLDPETHWTERREILELTSAGDQLFIENMLTSEIETYDDISDVYELYYTLSNRHADLPSFKFLPLWPELSMEQKLGFYDRFFCNEVNFFIFLKDPDFFGKVVKPMLESKVQKGFMDLYMLDRDVSAYSGLTKYQSLNTLERILLAKKVPALVEPTIKYLKDSVAGIPALPQESDSLFKAALESKQSAVGQLLGETAEQETFLETVTKEGAVIDQTREYQETRYYKVPFEAQKASLVPPSRFWLDYATFLLTTEGGNFLSKEFHTPGVGNLTQMLLGMCVINLPFRVDVKDATYEYLDDGSANLTVNGATLVLSRQIRKSEVQTSALSVSTNYFDPEDKVEVVDFEEQDKFLKMPLQSKKVYGCRIVITNVSSMSHTVEILSQIPQGAIPVTDGFRTYNRVEKIEPYTTWRMEFFFYFPAAGEFVHFQSRVSKNGKVIGYGKEDPKITVIDPEEVVDTDSWEYYSMKADNEALLAFLKTSPLVHTVDLDKIAYRMIDESLFVNVTEILQQRQIYNDTIWAYSMKHMDQKSIKQYLSMNSKMKELVAPDLQTSVLTDYDAFERQAFQVMEYWPLTSSRSHSHEFKNDFFSVQYREFLKCALYRSYSVESMSPVDKMTGVYYFLIQNRVSDAQNLFDQIDAAGAKAVSAFTYDYLKAFLSFYSTNVKDITAASELCDQYLGMTLPPSKAAMWQGVFEYIQEIKNPGFANDMFDPTTEADILSARARKLDCEVNTDRTITINYKNVDKVEINFYQTDIELQFSVAPFRQEHNAFNFVMPTDQIMLDLDRAERQVTVDLPATLHDKSSVVEVIGAGMTVSKANYDNHLRIEISAKLRQIRVFDKTTNKAISKAYVKVYGQTPDRPDGRFLKDGYTDLRGRFDYATVSTDTMEFVKALAILVLSPSAGADVLEIAV